MILRSTLAGRESEQQSLRALLATVNQGMSGALVLRGEPGIGKTALLDFLVAGAPNARAARLSGVESESALAFSGLQRLLVPFLSRVDTLPPIQQLALRTALGVADGPAPTPFLVGLAALSLLAEAAQDRPLLCVVDDCQWIDTESTAVLAFVARRLHADGIGMVFAVREPPVLATLEGLPQLTLSGLPTDAAADLLVALCEGRVDRHLAARMAAQTNGNPLALCELGRELALGRLAPGTLLHQPVPLGQRLETYYRARLAGLAPDTRSLLLLIASHIGDDPTVVWRAARLGVLDPEAAGPAESDRLIELRPTLRFPHPLIRAAVYAGAEPATRRRAHALLADATDADTSPELRAWHRAAAAVGPDETVAAELERCAGAAGRRGGYLAQAEYLTRAAELSADIGSRARRTLAAADAAASGGAPLRAEALLSNCLALSTDPSLAARARRLEVRVRYELGRPIDGAPALLLGVAHGIAAVDRPLARQVLLDATELTIVTGHYISGTTAGEVGRAAMEITAGADTEEVPDLLLAALGALAGADYLQAAPLLRRAVKQMNQPAAVDGTAPAWFVDGAYAAHALWDDTARHGWLERCERAARATGALHQLQLALSCLASVEAQTGDLRSAQARSEDSRQLARSIGWSEAKVSILANPELLAWQGRDAEARRAAHTAAAAAEMIRAGDMKRPGRRALMIIQLSGGHYPEALRTAGELRNDDTMNFDNDALPALVEAGVRSGRLDEAAAALQVLTERATASGTEWALGLSARSGALLADDPEPHFRAAIGHLENTSVVSDLARAHLLYGEWLRRQKRRSDARVELHHAHELLTAMGAVAFVSRVRMEMAAAGDRRTRPARARGLDLTPQEAQIARLAAAGAANVDIAAALFISPHTVGYHLGKIYRKLGVSSRQQLQGALGTS